MENEYQVRAIRRAMDVLKCFDYEHPEIGLLEFAEMLQLNKSTVYRLLCNLLEGGFVDMNHEGKYVIGTEVARLAALNRGDNYLKRIARNFMEELASRSGETVVLTRYERGKAICIDRIEMEQILRVTSEIGRNVPMLKGSTGKVILAFLDSIELERCLKVQEELFHLAYDREKLDQELKRINTQGYCSTTGELNANVTSLAVPLLDGGGIVLGSVAILAPETRLGPERIEDIRDQVLDGARCFSRQLGYMEI